MNFDLRQGHVCLYDFDAHPGDVQRKERPVVVVQCNRLNRTRLTTTVVVPLTSNTALAEFPGNTFLSARLTGLPKDSVALGHQVFTVMKDDLGYPTGILDTAAVQAITTGITTVISATP